MLAAIIIALVVVWAWSRWDRRPPDIREYSAVRAEWQIDRSPDQPGDEGAIRESLASKSAGSIRAPSVGCPPCMAAAVVPDTSVGQEAQQAFARQLETADVV